MRSLIEAALEYASRGWRVLPLHGIRPGGGCTCHASLTCQSAGKHPRIKDWQNEATIDPATIQGWWRKWPDSNIGIATGATSGIFVLDIDNKGGQAGDEAFEQLGGHGPEPTATVRTGRGRHLYFRYPRQPVRNSTGTIGPGLDVRGDGGYIVAPPSKHVTGENYHWAGDESPAKAPEWLLRTINPQLERRESMIEEDETTEYAEEVSISEGERNTKLFQFACALRASGLKEEEIEQELRQLNQMSCKPPLPLEEVHSIAESAARYPAGRDSARRKYKKDPRESLYWFRFEPQKWIADPAVRQMTAREIGWYWSLMVESWRSGGWLPNDPKQLAFFAHESSRTAFQKNAVNVLAQFERRERDGEPYLVHPGVVKLYEEAYGKYLQKLDAAAKSVASRRDGAMKEAAAAIPTELALEVPELVI